MTGTLDWGIALAICGGVGGVAWTLIKSLIDDLRKREQENRTEIRQLLLDLKGMQEKETLASDLASNSIVELNKLIQQLQNNYDRTLQNNMRDSAAIISEARESYKSITEALIILKTKVDALHLRLDDRELR